MITVKIPYIEPDDFVTNMKQINSQSDLTLMWSIAGPSYLTMSQVLSLHHFNLRSLHFQSLQSLPNWIQLPSSETSPVCSSFQSSSSYFTVERAAKTLHRMSPCTPVSIPAKITWKETIKNSSYTKYHLIYCFSQEN